MEVLIGDLGRGGRSVSIVREGGVGPSLWDTVSHELCIDGQTVSVWQYPDATDRERESKRITPDATQIADGNIDAAGQFRFYASGPLLALYVGSDESVRRQLADALGSTITPDAMPRGAFGGSVDANQVTNDLACAVTD